jgi:integrase
MPKLTQATPKYRKHRATGQAVVTISGHDHYLGPHGTKASKREYDRLVAEWLAAGRMTQPARHDPTFRVSELMAGYLRWAKGYYQGGSKELAQIKFSFRPLKELYGASNAAEFGPLALKAVRERMIQAGLCRKLINQRIGRIKRLFAWGVEQEVVPADVFHGLQAVKGLRRGRSEARESKPVKPVPEAFVDALERHLPPQIWAMIQLQRFTGMRPGEVTIMRTCDIDTTGRVWIYTPPRHKTERHGHERRIYLGPRAQSVLKPWLRTSTREYLFQPKEALEWRREQRRLARKTPLSCGNRAGTNRKSNPKWAPGDCYSVINYTNAIRRACVAAKVPPWHGHQLRHNAATWLRKEFGIDIARVVLGHRSAAVTETYAELDFAKAAEVMGRVG